MNTPHSLPQLTPEQQALAAELAQARREQPIMTLKELRAQTPSWPGTLAAAVAEAPRSPSAAKLLQSAIDSAELASCATYAEAFQRLIEVGFHQADATVFATRHFTDGRTA